MTKKDGAVKKDEEEEFGEIKPFFMDEYGRIHKDDEYTTRAQSGPEMHAEMFRKTGTSAYFKGIKNLDKIPTFRTSLAPLPNRIVWLHYSSGRLHWYVLALARKTGNVYGYAQDLESNYDGRKVGAWSEFSLIWIQDLCNAKIDEKWVPCSLEEASKKGLIDSSAIRRTSADYR